MQRELPPSQAGIAPEVNSGTIARFLPSLDANADETKEFIACHRLALAEIPSHRVRSLLKAANGLPSAVFTLGIATWKSPLIGLTEKQILRLQEAYSQPLDPKLLERATTTGTYALLEGDPVFPVNLLPLSDAPPLLFVRGTLLEADRFSIGIVGTRRATLYGEQQATRFARTFVENGLTVVSGGASGIDTAAHRGALDGAGRTIAVLGCGVDIVYPAANRALFAQIVHEGNGAIISEFALGTRPEPWRFPTRNRIIAGLSRASLLIETPQDSGALGTAKSSVEYGRDVYVVPGPVDTGKSRGGHRLIADGAILADSPEDVLISLGIILVAQEPKGVPLRLANEKKPEKTVPTPVALELSIEPEPMPLPDLPPDEAAFYAVLDATPKPFDTILQNAGLSPSQANVAATLLEMKRLIRRYPGNLFSQV